MSKKISELTAATTPLAGTELVEIVQSGVSKQVAASYLGSGSSGGGREVLTANRTYYVRTDGSDSNNGLTNTSGGAFLTIQKAVDVACYTLDHAGHAVTIQLGDGTYTGAVAMRPLVGAATLTIQGNSGTPANVLISTTSASAFVNNASCGATLFVKDLKIITTTSGSALNAGGGCKINFSNLNFGSAATAHIAISGTSRVFAAGSYAISGAAQWHILFTDSASFSCIGYTITITGTPAFSGAFALGRGSGSHADIYSNTFSGSATGTRYDLSLNATLLTYAATLPGSVAGTTATGGQYA